MSEMGKELQGDSSSNSTGNIIKSGYIDVTKRQNEDGTKSSFSKAFSNLKNSEFYEEPPPEIKAAAESCAKLSGAATKPSTKNCVMVSSRQRGNPILKFIRNVPWEYGDIIPDYVMGATTCAMFLSLRYHNLNPNYVHDRLKQLGRQYELRVLLVLVDVKDPHHELKQLTKICVMADMTLMLAWNQEEAGRIIEVYKIFEHKPPDLIMEKQDANPYSMLIDSLTSIKSINRTDAMTLLSNFGSLEKIVQASEDELSMCPGLGPQKASRLYKILHQPFKKVTNKNKLEQHLSSSSINLRTSHIPEAPAGEKLNV
ncbi:DNA excision repair protein ERCC-1 isoform X2 [Procambarus clarkii]|nr:DNA excision repair protein ERCC-1-like [Procambarus clarkii]XP_045597821.1 DNA excision repair protein ERCC-1-like [Procambarus clarkii]XP_045597822.1 DNA excision repair protein ERCC-1-like [Procambarus clarkii]XP_045597823.1 DNA excision repair protein ERCC-1-like [Procambarus clarkii]